MHDLIKEYEGTGEFTFNPDPLIGTGLSIHFDFVLSMPLTPKECRIMIKNQPHTPDSDKLSDLEIRSWMNGQFLKCSLKGITSDGGRITCEELSVRNFKYLDLLSFELYPYDELTVEMSEDKLRSVIAEARELGISAILFAGGEPFLRKDLTFITKDFPEIIFPVVTNGTLLDDALIQELKEQRNVWPVLSIEGLEEDTNERRGDNVYQRVQTVMKRLKYNGIFFGCSLMITRSNVSTITDELFMQELIKAGGKIFFFVEYVSVNEGTDDWALTNEQRADLLAATNAFRATLPGLFIAFPGDDEQFGGCLAAGRGFVHISPEGNLEPCPFSPYSDANLWDVSLKEGLQSHFLRAIRQNHSQLNETAGGCVLWTEREWVRSLLSAK